MPRVVLKYTACPFPSLINHRFTPSTQVFSRAWWGSTLGGESNQVLQEVRGAALAFLSRSVRTLCKPTAPRLLCNVSSVLSLKSKPRTTFPYPWETPTVCWRHLHWPRDTDCTVQSGRLLGTTFLLVGKPTMLSFHSKLLAGVFLSLLEKHYLLSSAFC